MQHTDSADALGHIRAFSKDSLRSPYIRVWLSGVLARPFIVGPVAGLRRWSDALAFAKAAAPGATDLDGPCVVALDDWPGERPALATAMERAVFDSIAASAKATGTRLASIRPWWAKVAGAINAGTASHFESLSTYLPRPGPSQTNALLNRVALAAGLSHDDVRKSAWMEDRWAEVRLEAAESLSV